MRIIGTNQELKFGTMDECFRQMRDELGLDGAELSFRFNGETGSRVWLDRIEVRALPVPEPSTLAMLSAVAIAGSIALIRRRR